MKRSFTTQKRVILERTTNGIAKRTVRDTKDSRDSMNTARRARRMRPLTHLNFVSFGQTLSSIENERLHGPRHLYHACLVDLAEKKFQPTTLLTTCQNCITALHAEKQRCKRKHTTKLKRRTKIPLKNLTVLETSWSWITQTYPIQSKHPVTKTKRCA